MEKLYLFYKKKKKKIKNINFQLKYNKSRKKKNYPDRNFQFFSIYLNSKKIKINNH